MLVQVRNKFYKFIIAVGVSELAGIVGAVFTSRAIPEWYDQLQKPALNPPAWVFGPVWTVLYLLMGVAAYLVWTKRGSLKVFWVQLGLNAIWSIIFFGLRNPGLALLDIVLLWLAILWTIREFAKTSRAAAWLLLPYILWVTFAIYLNSAIYRLN